LNFDFCSFDCIVEMICPCYLTVSLISDIHTELFQADGGGDDWTRLAALDLGEPDVLVIAGDWANFDGRVDTPARRQLQAWGKTCPVVLVLGNHDYRGGSLVDVRAFWQAHPIANVFLLDNDLLRVRGVTFLGTTLWTDLSPEALSPEVIGLSKDLLRIDGFDTDAWCAEHAASRTFLQGALVACARAGESAVVVSHHLPSFACVSERFRSLGILNNLYASDCEDLLFQAAAWLHGHTHDPVSFEVFGVPVVANPRGRPEERSWDQYAARTLSIRDFLGS
jgi:predicted phosphodiesterase